MSDDPRSEAPPSVLTGAPGELNRGLGLLQATGLNIANMVGIGPFITIPAFIAAMSGPQAMIAWVLAAILVLCDGLVWSELGAALPGSGGTYHFLKQIYSKYRWGRILPFLFIWQFMVSGAMEMASGYIGALSYLEYAMPGLVERFGTIPGGTRWILVLAVVLITLLLCRRIESIGWIAILMTCGTLLTVALVILSGWWYMDWSKIDFPENAFRLDSQFASGLGAAMLIAIYDYLGYYNVCHLGDEVREPSKTIPRAVMGSVILIALIYMTMNLCIIGVVPWRQAMESKNIAADFMETLYGRPWAVAFTWLILWTAAACMFSITLGYSRIPFAAARQGDFYGVFGKLHPEGRYPWVSLLALGVLTSLFCFLDLTTVISAAVCVRIVVQFLGQIVALHIVRTTRPDIHLPFRMWFYPIPSLIAAVGWVFVLATADRFALLLSLGVVLSGLGVYSYSGMGAKSQP
ncbi:MAG: APC family permease [Planctomycetota bacterium]|nr:MAG: APC family permease [Planctomycetota bacterium]